MKVVSLLFALQVQYKNMTPAEAYEHVRLRRPRVLLASAQWQVSYHQILHAFCMQLCQ